MVRSGDGSDNRNASCDLDLSKSPPIEIKALFSQPKDAGFSRSQDISSPLASFSTAGNTFLTPNPTVEEKTFCVPGNVNLSAEKQGQIKMYISQVCLETVSRGCPSFLQQAGLNLLISMTAISHMLAKSVSDMRFPFLSEESGCAKAQVLKRLMNLSETPALAGGWLEAHGLLSSLPLFIRNGNTESLLDALGP
ncbi:protein ARMCX6-like [Echinops telfairi]|uniref:Protein ARMCX6-like n=1 Tax=Echinops telfairi TaxID=9371 RepID=A0ABM0IZ57_ECHTE|nr:protein ARMCX6-like [Echinops telfairi]